MHDGYRSLLWYLLVGTRGGPNRIRILEELRAGPRNAHQLAEALGIDYRTTRHHLRLLEQNGVVMRPLGRAYASPYELAPATRERFGLIDEVRATAPRAGAADARRREPGRRGFPVG